MRPSLFRLSAAAAAVPMMLVPIARAQDIPTPTPQQAETQRITELTALVEAQNKLFEQQSARFQAQIDALGLPKAEGKTTLGADAGKIESWMLASGTLTEAARVIDDGIKTTLVVLLDSDDVLDLNKSLVLQREMRALSLALEMATPEACETQQVGALAVPPIAAIGAFLSLIRTDTELTGLTIEGAEGVLLNAIAGSTPGKYVIPSEIVRTNENGTTAAQLANLLQARTAVPACRALLEVRAKTTAEKATAPAQIAKLDAVAKQIDTYVTAIVTRGDGKPSTLEIAMVGDTITDTAGDFRVLRVRLEKAGGTLLKRANLFTAFGAPAVGITGGAVISWHLTNPATGVVDKGGVLVCRTKLTNLSDIHQGQVRASACGPQVQDPAYAKRRAQ